VTLDGMASSGRVMAADALHFLPRHFVATRVIAFSSIHPRWMLSDGQAFSGEPRAGRHDAVPPGGQVAAQNVLCTSP
jgi:hypothetical protein